MRAQQSKFLESMDSTAGHGDDDSEFGEELFDSDVMQDSKDTEKVICSLCHDPKSRSPVSFLILLQVCEQIGMSLLFERHLLVFFCFSVIGMPFLSSCMNLY